MYQGMKSAMVFDPKDSEEETEQKWLEWNCHKSGVAMEKLLQLGDLKEN